MSKLIFVTGATGYLASHIVHLLLEQGYRVRAAARGAKIDLLKDGYASYKGQLEVVEIGDVTTGDFAGVLNGVDAVIHIGPWVPSGDSPESILNAAVEGTINVIRQAQQAGVKKIVFTSSVATAMGTGWTLSDQDWNPVNKEDALKGSEGAIYAVTKTLAEQAVWEFADAHPEIDITTLGPAFLYGPFAPGMITPKPDYSGLSTSLFIYRLLQPDGTFPPVPGYADVRDVARAHVGALSSPPETVVGRKRILMASPHDLDYSQAIQLIAERRPELKERLADPSKTADFGGVYKVTVDLKRLENTVGVKADSYYSWEDTVLDTVDALIALEEKWKREGQ